MLTFYWTLTNLIVPPAIKLVNVLFYLINNNWLAASIVSPQIKRYGENFQHVNS
jgi:hypothetical protein